MDLDILRDWMVKHKVVVARVGDMHLQLHPDAFRPDDDEDYLPPHDPAPPRDRRMAAVRGQGR